VVPGPTGATGPTGAGALGLVFTANVYNQQTPTTLFAPLNVSGDPLVGNSANSTFSNMAVAMPVGCTFDSIYVNPGLVVYGLGGGGAVTATLYKNGSATALTASGTIGTLNSGGTVATASVNGNLTGQTVTVVAGDTVAIAITGAGVTSGSGYISVSTHCGTGGPG
jgi:hypothetical protein